MAYARVGATRGRGYPRRTVSGCLAALLAAAAFAFGASPAVAAGAGIFTSSPASPQSIGGTPIELDWSFGLGLTGDSASCEIQRDGSDFASVGCNLTGLVAPTGNVAYQASAAGSYRLVVTPSLLGINQAPAQSSSVVLKPATPTINVPSSPSADPTPHWSFNSDDPSAAASCALADDHGNTVDPAAPCASGYTAPNLHNVTPAPAAGSTTTYTLTVTVTDDGQSASASSSYKFVTAPDAPIVAVTTALGNTRHPGFTVTGLASNGAPVCALTDPGGVDITATAVTGCGASPNVSLAGEPDGSYTLTVTQSNLAGTSGSGSASYRLDTSAPAIPTLTPSAAISNQRHPAFALTDIESHATLACSVGGASSASVSQCGPSTVVLNLAAPAVDGTYTIEVTETDQAGNTSAAGTATYQLDTVAPVAPIVTIASASPSISRTPTWYWQFGRDDPGTAADRVSCRITNTAGWSYGYPGCPAALANVVTPTLGPRFGFDGTYTFTVTLTDPAGNSASRSATYVVDSTVPEGPTVFIVSPRSGAGTSRHPEWTVSGPAGSTLSCELRRGDETDGPLVSAASPCDGPVSYSLVGDVDGEYSLVVRATNQAGSVSSAESALYILAPPVPDVAAPAGQDASAVWSVSGANPADRLSCILSRGTVTVTGPATCSTHPAYEMSRLPSGTYTLSVVQIGAQNVRSAPGKASWSWDAGAATGPGSAPAGGGGGGTPGDGGLPSSSNSGHPNGSSSHKSPAIAALGGVIRTVIRTDKTNPIGLVSPVAAQYPSAHPNQFADGVASSISSVATAIAGAGGGTGFPLLLLGLVAGFLILQNRIDRRDPKLAFVSAAADDMVEFAPPPSWKEGL